MSSSLVQLSVVLSVLLNEILPTLKKYLCVNSESRLENPTLRKGLGFLQKIILGVYSGLGSG